MRKLYLLIFITIIALSSAFATTAEVSSWADLKKAIEDSTVDKIIVTANINVDCQPSGTAIPITSSSCSDATSAMHIARSLEIEGRKVSGVFPVIKRTGNQASYNKSLFEIYGNGTYDGIIVSFKNITIDGGANWGSTRPITGCSKKTSESYTRSSNNSGIAGRAIIDIANKATVNLENNCVIQNGESNTNCQTNADATTHNTSGSWRFGGGIRVEYDKDVGGGYY